MICIDKREIDADPKATQQTEFNGQLKKVDGVNTNEAQSMFVLPILEKIKWTRLKFSWGSVMLL